jgi:hypothetical protein
MRTIWTIAVCVVVGIAGHGIVAAPQQRPGEETRARVWVQNRDHSERIPVSIREVAPDLVLRTQLTNLPPVQIAGTPAITLAPGTVVPTRRVAHAWEYRSILVPTGADPVSLLQPPGLEGWELTGAQLPAPGGSRLVLRRPRQ